MLNRLTRRAIATGCFVALSACSLVSSEDATQCSTDADCAALGFTGYTCGSGGVCAAPVSTPPPGIVTPESPNGCESDDQCVAANGGRAAICPNPGPQGTCVNLATDICTVTGDYKNRNAVFLGAITAASHYSPNTAFLGAQVANEYALAVGEFMGLPGGGLPGGANGTRRPLVLVSCEVGGDNELLERASRHLLATVNVEETVIGGDVWAAGFQKVSAQLRKPAFYICSNCGANPRAWNAGVGDLANAWDTFPTVTKCAPGWAAKMPDVEALARADAAFPGGQTKLGIIGGGTAVYPMLAQQVVPLVQINGKSLGEQPDNYTLITYDAANDPLDEVAAKLAAFGPHVVLTSSGVEAARVILPVLEAYVGSGFRPQYLTGPNQFAAPTLDFVGGNDALRKRINGLSPDFTPRDSSRFGAFQSSYAQKFPGLPLPTFTHPYDTIYALGLATVAAGQAPGNRHTPEELSRALPKLKTGKSMWIGPGELLNILSELNNVGTVNLEGLNTTLDYEDNGEVLAGRYLVYCVKSGPALGASGQSFDPGKNALTGTYTACP
jgi:hypothetical protein